MEAAVDKPPKNGFVRAMRKVYNPLGFSKGYNALLWFIFDGAMLGFILSRFEYLNVFGVFCPAQNPDSNNSAAPGECYWYTNFNRDRIGIILHLGAILPAGFLVVFQFVPLIRYKFILYHRIAGYLIFLLVLISDAGAIMIANHTFGGDLPTQGLVGTLVIITTISLFMAYVNVKRLQIDQHRAWMLRAWFYFASIITLRIILLCATSIEALPSSEINYAVEDCADILFEYGRYGAPAAAVYGLYPACDPSSPQYSTLGKVVVVANYHGTDPIQAGAALALNFGMAGWLALTLHAIGIEIYLRLTPRESQRLRQLSYEKQLAAGFKDPGSSGLVLEKFGDADPWIPSNVVKNDDE